MPEQQRQQDSSLDFLWIIGILVAISALIWHFEKLTISYFVLQLRSYEIQFLNWLVTPLAKFISICTPLAQNLTNLGAAIQRQYGAAIEVDNLYLLSDLVGRYLRYPVALLAIFEAFWLWRYAGVGRFRHIYNTKMFRNLEQSNWPQITPVIKQDLVKTPLDKGPWAMSLSPMEFCRQHDLLDIRTDEHNKKIASLRREPAIQILSLQLGARWQGVACLPNHLKALLAIFAARIANDKDSAEKLLDQIAASAADKIITLSSLNFAGTDELLKKYFKHKKVQKIVQSHAYLTSLFASLLVAAREVGVLATSEFLWLKPLDRRMWYMLNSVGRSTAVAEICGAFAHWLTELRLGIPLNTPVIDEGVKGLELAISEMLYQDLEDD